MFLHTSRSQSLDQVPDFGVDLSDYLEQATNTPTSAVGGFSDVYKVKLGPKFVAVKAFRWFAEREEDKGKLVKVQVFN